ncbi:hypothetical protein ACE014_20215 [Shewanella xiamenensis]|uniref:hypothetical protein n=1 Tax=Shewanella TaxID=22 RepID=UPI0012E1AE2E|nr:hypothetical protein [Shewanella sp. Sh95]
MLKQWSVYAHYNSSSYGVTYMVNVNINRRENLHSVVKILGSQTEVAKKLNHEVLTQQILSSIILGKRPMHEHEARTFERLIGIPAYWMDEPLLIKKGWSLIREYQLLDDNGKNLINRFSDFLRAKS